MSEKLKFALTVFALMALALIILGIEIMRERRAQVIAGLWLSLVGCGCAALIVAIIFHLGRA